MSIGLSCPKCDANVPYNRGAAKLTVKCEKCGAVLTLPTLKQLDAESRKDLEKAEEKQRKIDLKARAKAEAKAKKQRLLDEQTERARVLAEQQIQREKACAAQLARQQNNPIEIQKQMLAAQQEIARHLFSLRITFGLAFAALFIMLFWTGCHFRIWLE